MRELASTPACRGCGGAAQMQYPRHATQAEYDALPDGLKPIDGVALIPVLVCGDCHPAPICEHPPADPAPCPVCHAQPGVPCVGRNGGPRACEHPERAAAQPAPENCTHAHRETCTDPAQCECTSDDEPPTRLPRAFTAPTILQTAASLGFPPGMLPIAAQWLADNDLNPARIRGQVRTGFTQDNRPAILLDYATGIDDGHGHEVVESRIIPVGD